MRYRVFDGTAGNGRFRLNGVQQAELANITVEAADLANFRYDTSTTGAGDTLWVQAYDGFAWSAWKSFMVNAPLNLAPIVTVQDLNPAKSDAFITGSALFSVTDSDDASMVRYRFFDGTAGNGRFQLNGTDQAELANVEINAADLANFRYRTSTTGAGDTLWVQAYDGFAWSMWKSFTVSAPVNVAPTVNVQDVTYTGVTSSLPASSLFTVTDPDDASMAQYRFYDSEIGSGRFSLNGVGQQEQRNVQVTAADLPNLVYETLGGSETIWVQVFDGIAWSQWKTFQITQTGGSGANISFGSSVTEMQGPSQLGTFTQAPDGIVEYVLPGAPIVTATDSAIQIGTTASISGLLSASDPNGDTIAAWQLWDATSDGGAFRIDGTTQAEHQAIDVMTSQLAAVEFLSGSVAGSDQLWARASDGTNWSEWKPFTVTTLAPV